ncbi:hypothetical protein F383_10472 [Gossypium arboreum]|uniref:Uncharacterized protein n=1 Tax=Gossypium arboreum TaxID=29729 RepID=A0A0B0P2T1_GOSAR|nr:hypothetical protein F383_24363 [Gossypium arboreum]KHG26221.1 hypothetical protein F383_10472 [Gossypium arboreum]
MADHTPMCQLVVY